MRQIFNFLYLIFNDRRLYHLNRNITYFPYVTNYISNVNVNSSDNSMKFSTMTTDQSKNIFVGRSDRFEGITVHSEKENCSIEDFQRKLEDSLEHWRNSNQRGIWFKVYLHQAEWVPVLAKKGFKYHHAKNDFVMMYLWLPLKEICNVPHYAHTMMGVGGVVINDKSQVLVVREKYFQLPHWKLPGGYVEPGENLVDAAIREVYEETNIQTEFQSLLTLRHGHGGMFGCSDIYVVISLKPLSDKIEKCEREIAECKWMDINEYMQHPNIHDLNRFFVKKHLEHDRKNVKIDCHHGIHQILQKPYTLYFMKHDDKNEKKEEGASSSENSHL